VFPAGKLPPPKRAPAIVGKFGQAERFGRLFFDQRAMTLHE
jgi:hypothetical protein